MRPWNDPDRGRKESGSAFDDILRKAMDSVNLEVCGDPDEDEEEEESYYYGPIPEYQIGGFTEVDDESDDDDTDDEDEVVYGGTPLTTEVKTIVQSATIPDNDQPVVPYVTAVATQLVTEDDEDDGEPDPPESFQTIGDMMEAIDDYDSDNREFQVEDTELVLGRYMIDFEYYEDLDVLKVDDRITPSSYTVNSIMSKAMDIADIEHMYDYMMHLKNDDEGFGDFIDHIIEFIIMRKHPSAIWTQQDYERIFKNVENMDSITNITALHTDMSDNQTYVYLWHCPSFSSEALMMFATSACMGIHNHPKFRDGMSKMDENDFNDMANEMSDVAHIGTISALIAIANELLSADGSFNPNIPGYSRNYMNHISAQSDEVANAILNDSRTMVVGKEFTSSEIFDNTGMYDYDSFFLTYIEFIESYKGNSMENVIESDDDESAETVDIPEVGSDENGTVNLDDFLDNTEEMNSEDFWNEAHAQVAKYAEDDTDYLQVANDMKISNAEVTANQALYSEYVSEHAIEHPEEAPISFDTFVENMPSTTKVVVTGEADDDEDVVESKVESDGEDEVEEESEDATDDDIIPVTAPPRVKLDDNPEFIKNPLDDIRTNAIAKEINAKLEATKAKTAEKPEPVKTESGNSGTINSDMFAKLTAAGLSPTATAEEKEQAFNVPLMRIQKKRPQQ